MDPRKRNTGVDLNLQIKVLQQDLEDLRQRLERLENQYDQVETDMDGELNDTPEGTKAEEKNTPAVD